ncbi:MAG: tRNA (adenosine(37)-N6)-dimethylallyltransferase MiaA [Anaerolineae bacterium]|nr:tRNA (adenosine(37)-N6)-dimethylallyltransferase MiaA [Anaerolineae bacterium]
MLVILGATAVGKTTLSLKLAQTLKGEIVSADSRNLYRGMDIGTAKPTPEERRQIRHHLIDIVDPDQTVAAAEYQDMAKRAIQNIQERGRLPMLVGGTGQYITALLEGWSAPRIPPNPELRSELEQFAHENGLEALYQRLTELDPDAASIIDWQNLRRVIRALEVTILTNIPFSQQRTKNPPLYKTMVIGLRMEREQLFKRADERVDDMIRRGFVEEVRRMLEHGYAPSLPSMSGLGYAQISRYLNGEFDLETATAETKRATRAFIRRQETWFRQHDHQTMWYNSDSIDIVGLTTTIRQWYSSVE